jgi:peptidase E
MPDVPSTRRILATSGGFVGTGLWGVVRPGGIMRRALELTGPPRPRICFVLTASGDDPAYLSMMYAAMSEVGCDLDHLALFPQPNRPPRDALAAADVIWVGGGSVANLLALWRLHGVDEAMHDAWERGAVLAGVSAGSICWHVGGPTDSFGAELQLAANGLALLPYGNAVHYDSEAQRRPLTHRLVAAGDLPMSFATDDRTGLLYEGTDPVEVVCDDASAYPEAAAYRVELTGGQVVETRLPVGLLR